ncbi:hypothetical protein L596_029419 [Steinernema carpocapsae]|uniref:Uncharacterized protein n=1 Tax=Steinernema carpocapsae TaxID=34508 RepID=A0A4U5LUK9_STECR|nr:hypothetical protein L596_029419 [Steinernema carpocapsae]
MSKPTKRPYSLLETAADSFEKAGYSLNKLEVAPIAAKVSRLRQAKAFEEKYSRFIKIPSEMHVFDKKGEFDLEETLAKAGQSITFNYENIQNPKVGKTECVEEIITACDNILKKSKSGTPNLGPNFFYLFFAVQACMINRNNGSQTA